MNKDIKNAIISRRSVRKFLSKGINKDIIEDILNVSARAPSGTNIQPWNVHVLTGSARDRICKKASSAFLDPKIDKKNDRLHYMDNFRDPYITREEK